MEENNKEYNPGEDPEFREQAVSIMEDLGIEEDEAELLVDDYLEVYE